MFQKKLTWDAIILDRVFQPVGDWFTWRTEKSIFVLSGRLFLAAGLFAGIAFYPIGVFFTQSLMGGLVLGVSVFFSLGVFGWTASNNDIKWAAQSAQQAYNIQRERFQFLRLFVVFVFPVMYTEISFSCPYVYDVIQSIKTKKAL